MKAILLVIALSVAYFGQADSLRAVHADMLVKIHECLLLTEKDPLYAYARNLNPDIQIELDRRKEKAANLRFSMYFTWFNYEESDAAMDINEALFDEDDEVGVLAEVIPGCREKNWWDSNLDIRAKPYLEQYRRLMVRVDIYNAAWIACQSFQDDNYLGDKILGGEYSAARVAGTTDAENSIDYCAERELYAFDRYKSWITNYSEIATNCQEDPTTNEIAHKFHKNVLACMESEIYEEE